MVGRKRTTAALGKLRGNPGKRTRPAEPQFATSIPQAPANLDACALEEWNRITAVMAAARIITEADMALLAAYCQSYSEWVAVSQEVDGQTRFLSSPNGYKYQNPAFITLRKLREELDKRSASLGITPVTRAKAQVVGETLRLSPAEERVQNLFSRVKK